MSLKNISLNKAYSSDSDDILYDFYIPSLKESIEYDRLAGFFSSKSLAIAARGILGLIEKGGTMRLIISPKLDKRDLEIIIDSHKKPEKYIEEKMLQELERLEDKFTRDHVYALGWMIANKKLEIKVAVACDSNGKLLSFEDIQQSSLFHQKVGILKDSEGNILTFSGSVNETAAGWLGNIEEFKVFRNWETSEEGYVEADLLKFKRFWNNQSQRIRVIKIPYAVEKRFIELAPTDITEIDLQKLYKRSKKKKEITLWQYQNDAIDAWFKNGMQGIFEMATGTGKTFAALGCLKTICEREKRLITVITCPNNPLIKQWLDDIDEFNLFCDVIITDSSIYKWRDKLMNNILDIRNEINDKLIILTTNNTFSTNDFIGMIKKSNVKMFLIADEVHGCGAPERKKGLIENYHYRLGLSATPKRWFDFEGTEELFDYFGEIVFKFPLKKAINTINPLTGRTFLVPYEYKPYFVELTNEELDEYERKTERIAKAYYRAKNKEEKNKWFSILLINRQKIVTDASNKYKVFIEILNDIKEIKNCLVYCSPQQMGKVQDILNSYKRINIIQHKFTGKEGTKPMGKYGGISEREFLLQRLDKEKYQILVAMKCLDEGVDVPSIKIAIILASTGNPRQYIQRRGRILRNFPGKEKAIIYDIIVVPTFFNYTNQIFIELEKKILRRELIRYKEFAYIALNAVDCLEKIERLEDKYKIFI